MEEQGELLPVSWTEGYGFGQIRAFARPPATRRAKALDQLAKLSNRH
jgi:hypothetical protein